MLWNRNRSQILEDWCESLDYSLEAGGTPVFDMGLSHNPLDGLLNVDALKEVSMLPQPLITQPLLAVGGSSPLWLLAIDPAAYSPASRTQTTADSTPSQDQSKASTVETRPSAPSDSSHSSAQPHTAQPQQVVNTAFTAVDPATHMACLTVNSGPHHRLLRRSMKARVTGLPLAIRSLTIPQLEPAVISTWQALPLTMALSKQQLRSVHPIKPSALSSSPLEQAASDFILAAEVNSPEPEPQPAENRIWESAAALLVCVLLILAALV